jgi:hypothetical protein
VPDRRDYVALTLPETYDLTREHPPQSQTVVGSPKTSVLDRSGKSLCKACGLCCDGTLFHQVSVDPDDKADRLLACGIEIVSDQNNVPTIKQPCNVHKNHYAAYIRSGLTAAAVTSVNCCNNSKETK